MPIKDSAIKELRKTKKRVVRNTGELMLVDRLIRQTRKAITTKAADVATLLKTTMKTLDKAVAHGVMKKNTVARLKSRLEKRLRVP